jgi:hypothetical protein
MAPEETLISYTLNTEVVYNGRRFSVDMDYRNVLTTHMLFKDKEFTDEDKVYILIDIYCPGFVNRLKLWRMSLLQRSELLKLILSELVDNKMHKSNNPQRTMDFTQDAAPIYASFMQAYRINLQTARLDWREFMALLQGLPADTQMKEIIRIRTEPMPKADKNNAKQIHKLAEAKAYYQIELSEEERKEEFQRSLDKFAGALAYRAKMGQKKVPPKGGTPSG